MIDPRGHPMVETGERETSHLVLLPGRLLGAGAPAINPGARFMRRALDERSWVDVEVEEDTSMEWDLGTPRW